ncbi:MAG: FadR/GntR family transcriptional regulator [Deferrisomatales bacterium]|nr:FadR/GntR family transcriptional regulator [Deferrisomatales bacterium]
MSTDLPIKRTSAADEVFRVLHDRIMSGALQHGDRLPSQDKLAEQLSVSRNTLREAIHKLQAMGLLSAKQGVGTVVELASPASYVGFLQDHLLLNPSTVREFLEARLFVEKAVVTLAVLRASHEQVEQLGKALKEQRAAFRAGDIESFGKLDAAFHLDLARLSGNQVLGKLLETIRDLLSRFIAEVSLLPGAVERALRFHEDILARVAARDSTGAERKMVEHISDVVRAIEANTGSELNLDALLSLSLESIDRRGGRR